MHRCIELARLGSGHTAPNPMVGAVLVHEGRIIGEGYHHKYGSLHAEPECIRSVLPEREHLIPESTLYVSLEPCAHYGKTPPCADLIIEKRIPRVVIGCRDPFPQVNGRGIEKLKAAGIEIKLGVLEKECLQLNRRFFTFHTEHRPYIILKWAQTLDARTALPSHANKRLMITNEYTNRLVHKWRSEEMAILVGTNTALLDDPELTTRLWPGNNPIRLVVDMDLKLPEGLSLFNGKVPTVVFNARQHSLPDHVTVGELRSMGTVYYQVTEDVDLVPQIMHALYRMNILSVLVEGGSYLLQSFIEADSWDEARIITNLNLAVGDGLPAPVLKYHQPGHSEQIFSDLVQTVYRKPVIN